MEEVKKLYQIAVVVTDTDKRMIVASQEGGVQKLVLDISGEEAVSMHQGLIDLLCRTPTRN